MTDFLQEHLADNGILTLTFNRPDKKNAFNKAMWQQFTDSLLAARENPAVACVILTGAGKDFSSGMDLNDFSGGGDANDHPFYHAQKALCEFDKPLIAAAKGIAIGGGATILFHCDLIYIGESLRFKLPFTSLGLVPEFAASYTLQAMIGSRKAAEIFYTAQWLDADKVLEAGIANAIIPDENLLAEATAKATEIAKWPVSSLQATKQCLKSAHTAGISAAMKLEREGMDRLAGGPENIEAVMAFMEKRDPDFSKFRQ